MDVGIDGLNPNEPRHDVAADVIKARRTLEEARSALDLAMAALPDVGGDEAMATPTLLALLVGAVRANEHLIKLEGREARESGRYGDHTDIDLTAPPKGGDRR